MKYELILNKPISLYLTLHKDVNDKVGKKIVLNQFNKRAQIDYKPIEIDRFINDGTLYCIELDDKNNKKEKKIKEIVKEEKVIDNENL